MSPLMDLLEQGQGYLLAAGMHLQAHLLNLCVKLAPRGCKSNRPAGERCAGDCADECKIGAD